MDRPIIWAMRLSEVELHAHAVRDLTSKACARDVCRFVTTTSGLERWDRPTALGWLHMLTWYVVFGVLPLTFFMSCAVTRSVQRLLWHYSLPLAVGPDSWL